VRHAATALGGELLIEHEFHLESLSALYWGTADCVIINPPVLWVCDLKTGAGHPVPIRRPDGRVNLQLGGYALGALHSLPPGVGNEITEVALCVVQPRLGPPQDTTMSAGEVQDLAADLIEIAEAAQAPDAPLVAGDHCRFCRASGDCPELRRVALERASVEFDLATDPAIVAPMPPSPASLTPDQLGRILIGADLLEAWLTAVRARAKALADKGVEILDHKLVNRRGRRIWVDETEAAKALNPLLPADDLYVVKTVSPAQADKALKRLKAKRPGAWDKLVTTTDPGTALVPLADPRPAVSPRAVEFSVEQEEQ
jgi:hypothetical protein